MQNRMSYGNGRNANLGKVIGSSIWLGGGGAEDLRCMFERITRMVIGFNRAQVTEGPVVYTLDSL